LVQNSSDVITVLEADGTVRYVSPAIERMLAYTPEERAGRNGFELLHPDDIARARSRFAEILRNPGVAFSIGLRIRHRDGSWRHVEFTGTNLLDDQSVGGIVVNWRDTTERKEAEQALKDSEERYRTLVERLPAVTFVDRADSSGKPLYASPQVEGMFGYAPDEWMAGRLWRERLHPDDRGRVLASDERFKATGGTVDQEYRLLARDGSVVWVREETILVRGAGGEPLYVQGIMSDVTERKALEEKLEHLAFHDGLTGLANRRLFVDRLGQALGKTGRHEGRKVAVLFMDLDDFKHVNDSLGHEAGDLLLTVVAQRLERCLRTEDTLARFGGDEFVVLVEDTGGPEEAVRVAERIVEGFGDPFRLDGRELYARASIGIATGDARTKTPEDLLRDADTAMYRAKEAGSGYSLFDPAMHERAVGRLELENDLRRAIREEEFVVHYQPIVRLHGGEVFAVEALVRWQHPERGLLNPGEFVPIAEESGLVVPMGEAVLGEACRRAKGWQEEHPRMPPLVMSVNLSARQLARPDLAETVKGALRESGLEGRSLSLDVTETVFIKALESNTAALAGLKGLGVGISIDDFGTGYSSLAYLKRLPADALKIDRSFVKGLGEDIEDTAIVQTVVELAHTIGMEVIAEGVESEEQAILLAEMGCDLAQGYLFSKPLTPEDVPRFLEG